MFKNDTLARFLAIKQEIKRLEKEQAEIKSQIEAAGGNFETYQFEKNSKNEAKNESN